MKFESLVNKFHSEYLHFVALVQQSDVEYILGSLFFQLLKYIRS